MGPRLGARSPLAPSGAGSRRWPTIAAVSVALLALAGVVTWRNWQRAPRATTAAPAPLVARTVDAGAVSIRLEPQQLDAAGAVIEIGFDTHSGALALDVARNAQLVVGASTWPVAGWSGDGPGGHHRQGQLRFTPAGPATGSATLTIGGLPQPVVATWELGK